MRTIFILLSHCRPFCDQIKDGYLAPIWMSKKHIFLTTNSEPCMQHLVYTCTCGVIDLVINLAVILMFKNSILRTKNALHVRLLLCDTFCQFLSISYMYVGWILVSDLTIYCVFQRHIYTNPQHFILHNMFASEAKLSLYTPIQPMFGIYAYQTGWIVMQIPLSITRSLYIPCHLVLNLGLSCRNPVIAKFLLCFACHNVPGPWRLPPAPTFSNTQQVCGKRPRPLSSSLAL